MRQSVYKYKVFKNNSFYFKKLFVIFQWLQDKFYKTEIALSFCYNIYKGSM